MLKRFTPIILLSAMSFLLHICQAFAMSDQVTSSGNIAVSHHNYKAGAVSFSGPENVDGGVGATGQWTTAIGEDYGFQLGGFVGGTDDHGLFNITAHGFKRNWEKGIIGIVGSVSSGTTNHDFYSNNKNIENGKVIGRLGIEGSQYWHRFNIGGVMGAEHDYETSRTGFYDRLGVDYYATDNFKTGIFHQYTGHRHGGGLKAEYLFKSASDTPLSLYGEVNDGKDYPLTFTVGMRVLFGADGHRSLQTRDHHDYVEDFIPKRMGDSHRKSQLMITPASGVGAGSAGSGSGSPGGGGGSSGGGCTDPSCSGG